MGKDGICFVSLCLLHGCGGDTSGEWGRKNAHNIMDKDEKFELPVIISVTFEKL
jgi:hypothetical protein